VSISLPLKSGDRQYGLFQLGARHDGLPFSTKDQAKIKETVGLLGDAIASRRNEPPPA
jgi:hypothetical protein